MTYLQKHIGWGIYLFREEKKSPYTPISITVDVVCQLDVIIKFGSFFRYIGECSACGDNG